MSSTGKSAKASRGSHSKLFIFLLQCYSVHWTLNAMSGFIVFQNFSIMPFVMEWKRVYIVSEKKLYASSVGNGELPPHSLHVVITDLCGNISKLRVKSVT